MPSFLHIELPTLVQHAPDLDVSLCSWNISVLSRVQPPLGLCRVAEDIIAPLDATLDELHPCRSLNGGSSIAEPRIYSFHLTVTNEGNTAANLPIVLRVLLMTRSSSSTTTQLSVVSEYEEEIHLGAQPFTCGSAGKLLIQLKNRKQDPHVIILVAELGLTFDPFHSGHHHPLVQVAKPLSLFFNRRMRAKKSRRINVSLSGFSIETRERAVIAANALLFQSSNSSSSTTTPSILQGRIPPSMAVLTMLGDPLRRLEVLCALSRASGDLVSDPVSLGFATASETGSTAVFGSTTSGGGSSIKHPAAACGWSIELTSSVMLSIPLSSAQGATDNNSMTNPSQLQANEPLDDFDFEDDSSSPADAHKDVSDIHLLFYVLSHSATNPSRKEFVNTKAHSVSTNSKRPTCVAFSYLQLFDDQGQLLCDPKSESPLNPLNSTVLQSLSHNISSTNIVACGDGSVGISAPLVLYPGSPPFLPADPRVNNEAAFIPSQASRLVTSDVDVQQSTHLRPMARVPPHLRLLEASVSALDPFSVPETVKPPTAKKSAVNSTMTPSSLSSTVQQVLVEDAPRAQTLGLFPTVMRVSIVIVDTLSSGSCIGDTTLRSLLAASHAAEVEDKELAVSSAPTPSHIASVRGKSFTPQHTAGLSVSNLTPSFAANMNLRALIASLSDGQMISRFNPGRLEASFHGWKAISCVVRVHLAAVVALRSFENKKQARGTAKSLSTVNQIDFEKAALTGILPGTYEEGEEAERDAKIFKNLMLRVGVPSAHLPPMCSYSNLSMDSTLSSVDSSTLRVDGVDDEENVFAEKQAEVAAGGLRVLLRIISSSFLRGDSYNIRPHSLSLYSEKRIFGQVVSSPTVEDSRGLFEAGILPPGPFSTCLLMCRIGASGSLTLLKSNNQQQQLQSLSDWLLDWSGLACSALNHAVQTGQLLSVRVDEAAIAAASSLNPVYLYPTQQTVQSEGVFESNDSSTVSPFLHAVHSFRSLLLLTFDSLLTITDGSHNTLEKDRFLDSLILVVQRIASAATTAGANGGLMKNLASSFLWIPDLLSRIVSLLILTSSDSNGSLEGGLSLDRAIVAKRPQRVLTAMATPRQQMDESSLKTPISGRATMSIIDKYRMTTGRSSSSTASSHSTPHFSVQNVANGKPLSLATPILSDSTSGALVSRRLRASSSGQQTLSGSSLVSSSKPTVSVPLRSAQLLSESESYQSANNLLSESVAITYPQSMLKDVLVVGSDADHPSLDVRASLLDMCCFFFSLVSQNSDTTGLRVLSPITVQHLACFVSAEISRSESALIKSTTIACASLCSLVERRGCVPGTEYALDALFQSSATASVDAVNTLSTSSAARSSRFLILALRLSRALSMSGLSSTITSDYDKRCFSRAVQFVLPSLSSQRVASIAMSAATLRCVQDLLLTSSGSWTVRSRWPTVLRNSLHGSRSKDKVEEDDAEDSPADGYSCMMWAVRDSCLFLNNCKDVNVFTDKMGEEGEEEEEGNVFPIPRLSSEIASLVSKPLLLSVLPLIASIESNDSSVGSEETLKDLQSSRLSSSMVLDFDSFIETLKQACKTVTSVSPLESNKSMSNMNDTELLPQPRQGPSLLSSLISALISSLSSSSSLKESTGGVTSAVDSLWLAVTSALSSAVSTIVKAASTSAILVIPPQSHRPAIPPPPPRRESTSTSSLLESIRVLTTLISALTGRAFYEGVHLHKRHQRDRYFRQHPSLSTTWNPQNASSFLSKCLMSLRDAEAFIEEKRPDYAECCDMLLYGKGVSVVVEAITKVKPSIRGVNPPLLPLLAAANTPRKSLNVVSTVILRIAVQWSGSAFVNVFSREATEALDSLQTQRRRKRRSSRIFTSSSSSTSSMNPFVLIREDEDGVPLIAAVTLASAANSILFGASSTGAGEDGGCKIALQSLDNDLRCLAFNKAVLSDSSTSILSNALLVVLGTGSISSPFLHLNMELAEAVRDLHDTAVTLGDVSSAYGFASLAVAVCGVARDSKPDQLADVQDKTFLAPNGLAWPNSLNSPGAADHASCASDSLHAPIDSLPLAHTVAQKARDLVEVVRAEERGAQYSPVANRGIEVTASKDVENASTRTQFFFSIDQDPTIYLFPSLSRSKSSSVLQSNDTRPPQPLSQLLTPTNLLLLATARELHVSFALAFGACLAAREYELALDVSSTSYAELVRVLNRMQVNEADSLSMSSLTTISSSSSLLLNETSYNEHDVHYFKQSKRLQSSSRVTFDINSEEDTLYGKSMHPQQRTNRAGTVKMVSSAQFIPGIVQGGNQQSQELSGDKAILARALGLLLRDCAAGEEAAAYFAHGSLPPDNIRNSWESMLASPTTLRGRKARLSAGPGKHSFCSSLVSYAFTLRNGMPPIIHPTYAAVGFCSFSGAQEGHGNNQRLTLPSPPHIEWRLTRLPVDTSVSEFAAEVQKSNPKASIFGPDSVYLLSQEAKDDSLAFCGTGALASDYVARVKNQSRATVDVNLHVYILPAIPSHSLTSSEDNNSSEVETIAARSVPTSESLTAQLPITTPFSKENKRGDIYSSSHCKVFKAPFSRRRVLFSSSSNDLVRPGSGVLLHSGGFKLHKVKPDELVESGQSSGVSYLQLTINYSPQSILPLLPWTTRLARMKEPPHVIETSLISACADWAADARERLQSRINWTSSVYLESFLPASSTAPAPPIFAPAPATASLALALLPPSLPDAGMPDDSFFDTHYEKGGQGCGSIPTPLVQALLSGRYSLDLNPAPISISTKVSAQMISATAQRQNVLSHLSKRNDARRSESEKCIVAIVASGSDAKESLNNSTIQKVVVPTSSVNESMHLRKDDALKNEEDKGKDKEEEEKSSKDLDEDDLEGGSKDEKDDEDDEDDDNSTIKRSSSNRSRKNTKKKKNEDDDDDDIEEVEEEDVDGTLTVKKIAEGGLDEEIRSDFSRSGRSRSTSSLSLTLPIFGGLGTVSLLSSSSFISDIGGKGWRDRTHSLSSVASSRDTETVSSLYEESDDDELEDKDGVIRNNSELVSSHPPHVPLRLYRLPRLTLSQTFALLMDDLSTGMPPHTSTGSRRSGGLPVASLVISPQRPEYAEGSWTDVLLLIDIGKRALVKLKQGKMIHQKGEGVHSIVAAEGKEDSTSNSTLIIPTRRDYCPGLDASSVAVRLRGLAGIAAVPLFPAILPPLVLPKLPPFPEQIFPSPEEGGAPVGQAIVPSWLASLVMSAGVADIVHPAWSSVCGLQISRQAIHDYAELKVIEREKATTELRREFCRWEESERAAGRGDDVDAYPIPDWPNAIPKAVHAVIPLLEAEVNQALATAAVTSMFVLPNIAASMAVPTTGDTKTSSSAASSIQGATAAAVAATSALNSSLMRAGDANGQAQQVQQQLNVHRIVLTGLTRISADFDGIFSRAV